MSWSSLVLFFATVFFGLVTVSDLVFTASGKVPAHYWAFWTRLALLSASVTVLVAQWGRP